MTKKEERQKKRDEMFRDYYKMQLEQNDGCTAPILLVLMIILMFLV